MKYLYDSTALSRDPNLYNFAFDPGSLKPTLESEDGIKAFELLTSRYAVAALMGAVYTAPGRLPPVPAIEELLLSQLGERAFTDPMKQLTGRIIKQIVDHLGGYLHSRNAQVAPNSRFRRGSTYVLPTSRIGTGEFDGRAPQAGKLVQVQVTKRPVPKPQRTVVVEVKKRRVGLSQI